MSPEKEDTRDLYIRTPLEEFKAFSRHRIELLEKFEDVDELKRYRDAFELGVAKLNAALAAPPPGEEEEEPSAEAGDGGTPGAPEESPAPEPAEAGPDGAAAGEEEDELATRSSLRILETEYVRGSEQEAEPAGAAGEGGEEAENAGKGGGAVPLEMEDLYREPQTEILHESVIAEYRGEDETGASGGGEAEAGGGEEDAGEESGDAEEDEAPEDGAAEEEEYEES